MTAELTAGFLKLGRYQCTRTLTVVHPSGTRPRLDPCSSPVTSVHGVAKSGTTLSFADRMREFTTAPLSSVVGPPQLSDSPFRLQRGLQHDREHDLRGDGCGSEASGSRTGVRSVDQQASG